MQIIFEDSDFIAADKPTGISSIQERLAGPCALSLAEAAAGQKLFIVHRIDKAVSGAIIFAKNAEAHRRICGIFERREVSKHYTALLHGIPEPPDGEINMPLRVFGSGRTAVDLERGKPSLTKYATLSRFRYHTLADVRIITGRRHQIRAHFYAIGHPVAGDLRYGDKAAQSLFPRLMLHSTEIAFSDEGEQIKIAAPLPELFTKTLEGLEKND